MELVIRASYGVVTLKRHCQRQVTSRVCSSSTNSNKELYTRAWSSFCLHTQVGVEVGVGEGPVEGW